MSPVVKSVAASGNSTASSRLIVHKDVKDQLLGLITEHLKVWKLGDPLDPDNRLGAMVSKSHFEKVRSYLEYAAEHKLSIVQGGESEDGVFEQPTIDEAIALANDTQRFVI